MEAKNRQVILFLGGDGLLGEGDKQGEMANKIRHLTFARPGVK